ncbi:hypothetical protein [Thiohalobacter thiocyanaticus]|uniref:Uncharacterized protein n=1 Tax=Thiohalobacter thiocyanaticus TaxID=585455 RepID=A0A426QJQ5_9GAMM|nr:hypothetical protein [Thiohalobacter thiocyanaticus]RRQ21937.1 hypothetical protein D6C00_08225 [Thiohalobacter thiocyanaticus]
MQFTEVNPEDFTRITLERLPHQEIETALIAIGGNGVEGTKFKGRVLKAAGWKYERLTTYASYPETAAEAFNRVRGILQQTREPEQILAQLG